MTHPCSFYAFFLAAAALALAAFFLLLRIMTTLRKDPTTALPRSTRITGMRIAQTRGGKKFWRGWSESTKGFFFVLLLVSAAVVMKRGEVGKRERGEKYHHQGPDGVVEKDDRRGHEHGEADEFVELCWGWVWHG